MPTRHVYSLSTIGTDAVERVVTSTEILARLRAIVAAWPPGGAHAARTWLAHVDDLESRPLRYPGEARDVLASALRCARAGEAVLAKRPAHVPVVDAALSPTPAGV